MAFICIRIVFGEGRYFIQKDWAEQNWLSGTHSTPLSVLEWDCLINQVFIDNVQQWLCTMLIYKRFPIVCLSWGKCDWCMQLPTVLQNAMYHQDLFGNIMLCDIHHDIKFRDGNELDETSIAIVPSIC